MRISGVSNPYGSTAPTTCIKSIDWHSMALVAFTKSQDMTECAARAGPLSTDTGTKWSKNTLICHFLYSMYTSRHSAALFELDHPHPSILSYAKPAADFCATDCSTPPKQRIEPCLQRLSRLMEPVPHHAVPAGVISSSDVPPILRFPINPPDPLIQLCTALPQHTQASSTDHIHCVRSLHCNTDHGMRAGRHHLLLCDVPAMYDDDAPGVEAAREDLAMVDAHRSGV
jgi:hypothetical protein